MDGDVFRPSIERLLPRLWRFCLVLTGDRGKAEDLAQAACLRALEREHQYQPGTRLDRWLFRITHSIWLNQLRAEKTRRGAGTLPVEQAGLVDLGTDAESSLHLTQVLSDVMALPPAQRIVTVLVYVEGYSYKEAAEHLGVPIGTVMSRLSVARSQLLSLHERSGEGLRATGLRRIGLALGRRQESRTEPAPQSAR